MELSVDDFFYNQVNISDFTTFKDTCLKLNWFASIFGKHSWIFLIFTWFLKADVNWFMSMSEEFLIRFMFSCLVVLMKNLFIVLEIDLSFLMIASFATSVMLLESFLTEVRFCKFQKLVISYDTNIYIVEILLFWFSEKIQRNLLGFIFTSIFMT